MSDDYEAENSPNEEELMEQLDAYLSGAPVRVVMDPGPEPSILDIQLQQAAERIEGRRRVDGEGRGIWNPDFGKGEPGYVQRPASPLQRDLQARMRGLSEHAHQEVMAAIKRKMAEAQDTAAQIVSNAEAKAQVIIDPPRNMEPENVDRMIADALEQPSPLPSKDARHVAAALEVMRDAITMLREVDDPIIKRAVTDLEMAAIGVAMQAERHG